MVTFTEVAGIIGRKQNEPWQKSEESTRKNTRRRRWTFLIRSGMVSLDPPAPPSPKEYRLRR